MSEKELRGGDVVVSVKVAEGKQAVPVGTRGRYLGEMPGAEDLHGIEWDEDITIEGRKGRLVLVLRNEFSVVEEAPK